MVFVHTDLMWLIFSFIRSSIKLKLGS